MAGAEEEQPAPSRGAGSAGLAVSYMFFDRKGRIVEVNPKPPAPSGRMGVRRIAGEGQ